MARGASPLEALIGVIGEGEGRDDQLAGHAAELPAEPLHILADALVPGTNQQQSLDQGAGLKGWETKTVPCRPALQCPWGTWTPTRAGFPEATRPSGS